MALVEIVGGFDGAGTAPLHDADGMQYTVEIMDPVIEKTREAREIRRAVPTLPGETLQERWVIGQVVKNLRRGQTPAADPVILADKPERARRIGLHVHTL